MANVFGYTTPHSRNEKRPQVMLSSTGYMFLRVGFVFSKGLCNEIFNDIGTNAGRSVHMFLADLVWQRDRTNYFWIGEMYD
jgi:hypothetical protein